MTFKYLSSDFSQRNVWTSKTQPTTDGTADPTIDSTVDAASKPSSELWPTPTLRVILSLGVNSKEQKWLLNFSFGFD